MLTDALEQACLRVLDRESFFWAMFRQAVLDVGVRLSARGCQRRTWGRCREWSGAQNVHRRRASTPPPPT